MKAASPCGETLEELKSSTELYLEAFTKPVLKWNMDKDRIYENGKLESTFSRDNSTFLHIINGGDKPFKLKSINLPTVVAEIYHFRTRRGVVRAKEEGELRRR